MVSKDTKEIFNEHMIAETIKSDLAKIKVSAEMQAFTRGLKFKSDATKQTDLKLINLLIIKCEQYAKGWILANACKTGELWRKSSAFDEQVNLMENELKGFLKELDKITDLLKS